jgi:hypothetical protein
MLTSEVLSQVKRRFADEQGIIIIDQDIYDWINEASREILRITEANATVVTGSGTTYSAAGGRLNVPAAMLFKSATYNNIPLEFTTQEFLEATFGDLTTAINGTPLYYYLETWGQDSTDPNATIQTSIKLYPSPPSDATSMSVTYLKAPTKVTASTSPIDVPLAFHGAVMNFCLARANERVQNWQAFGEYMEAFNQGIAQSRYEAQSQDDSYPVIRDDPTLEPFWW